MTHDANEIRDFIRERDNFYIAGHTNPDGDSIGACFGLGLALEKIGKKVKVLMEAFHPKYNVIPGRHLLYAGEDYDPQSATLICIDCADIGRLTGLSRIMAAGLADTICIDHHYSNTAFAKYNFVDGAASSACEMVYRLFGGFLELDQNIAAALYAGMLSDTGGFRYNATSQDTLRASASLVATGIPFNKIYTEMLHLRSYTEVKLLGRILESCNRSEDGKIVYVCVTKAMRTNLEGASDAGIQDMEGVVEYLLNIRGAEVALLVYDRGHNDEIKISLRSRSISVASIAQKFGGGGHQLAAGATVVSKDIFEICSKVLLAISQDL